MEENKLKKLLKSFTFWFVIISLLGIYMHQTGGDSKSIVLKYCNPILRFLTNWDKANEFMSTGFKVACKTIGARSISIYWYIGSVLTWAFYGAVLDFVKYLIKKKKVAAIVKNKNERSR